MSPPAPSRLPGWRVWPERPLPRFALTALALYAAWFLLYETWLGPDGRLDLAMSHVVAEGASGVLAALGFTPTVVGDTVWATRTAGAWVTTGCNGLTTLALFTGFVLAYPGTWRRRGLFLPLGVAFVFAVNVLRVAGIVVILARAPGHFEWVHALGAPHVFYATVFVLWVLWVRYSGASAEEVPALAPATAPAPQPA
jgi:exosortase family protein XrtF